MKVFDKFLDKMKLSSDEEALKARSKARQRKSLRRRLALCGRRLARRP